MPQGTIFQLSTQHLHKHQLSQTWHEPFQLQTHPLSYPTKLIVSIVIQLLKLMNHFRLFFSTSSILNPPASLGNGSTSKILFLYFHFWPYYDLFFIQVRMMCLEYKWSHIFSLFKLLTFFPVRHNNDKKNEMVIYTYYCTCYLEFYSQLLVCTGLFHPSESLLKCHLLSELLLSTFSKILPLLRIFYLLSCFIFFIPLTTI